MNLADAPAMTLAGKVIVYFIVPLLVVGIPSVIGFTWRARRESRSRAVALAVAQERMASRMDTQDAALARLLEVINPVGAPNLTAVLARIQADGEADRLRLTEHISAAQADKASLDRRIEQIAGQVRG